MNADSSACADHQTPPMPHGRRPQFSVRHHHHLHFHRPQLRARHSKQARSVVHGADQQTPLLPHGRACQPGTAHACKRDSSLSLTCMRCAHAIQDALNQRKACSGASGAGASTAQVTAGLSRYTQVKEGRENKGTERRARASSVPFPPRPVLGLYQAGLLTRDCSPAAGTKWYISGLKWQTRYE